MRNLLVAMMVVGLCGIAGADKAGKPNAASEKKPGQADKAAGDKITGEVVDITCYAGHDAKGEKHASCAQKCLTAGMPAGIVADGKLYVVTMKDHTSPAAKLASWGGKMVTATGKLTEKEGTHVFEIDAVSPAAAAPTPAK